MRSPCLYTLLHLLHKSYTPLTRIFARPYDFLCPFCHTPAVQTTIACYTQGRAGVQRWELPSRRQSAPPAPHPGDAQVPSVSRHEHEEAAHGDETRILDHVLWRLPGGDSR